MSQQGWGRDGGPSGEGRQAPGKSSQNKCLENKFLSLPPPSTGMQRGQRGSSILSFQPQRRKDRGCACRWGAEWPRQLLFYPVGFRRHPAEPTKGPRTFSLRKGSLWTGPR